MIRGLEVVPELSRALQWEEETLVLLRELGSKIRSITDKHPSAKVKVDTQVKEGKSNVVFLSHLTNSRCTLLVLRCQYCSLISVRIVKSFFTEQRIVRSIILKIDDLLEIFTAFIYFPPVFKAIESS